MGELRETINELLNLQSNKLFRTLKGLTVDPGNTIRTFAEGDRTTFFTSFYVCSHIDWYKSIYR